MNTQSIILVGFEASGIQRYIMERNTLRQMVGASALVEGVGSRAPTSPLIGCLTKLLITPIAWGRSGGGGFVMQLGSELEAQKFLATWPLVLDAYAPGLGYALEMVQAESIYEAWKKLGKQIRRAKNVPSYVLPLTTMPMLTDKRSGEPVAAGAETSHAGRRKLEAAVVLDQDKTTKLDAIAHVLNIGKQYLWPRDMSAQGNSDSGESGASGGKANEQTDVTVFPYLSRFNQAKTTVGVIHIDGNGFGLLGDGLLKFKDQADQDKILVAQAALSKLITDICHQAAEVVVKKILLPKEPEQVIPARPLILAGEDVSFIVRGDLALPFVNAFVEAFEVASMTLLKGLKDAFPSWTVLGLPEKLTASAGVALVSANYPFDLAHQLAEELCKEAKRESKSYNLPVGPGTVVFDRVTASLQDETSGVNPRLILMPDTNETAAQNGDISTQQTSIQLGRCAYAIEPTNSNIAIKTPTLASLMGFADYLQKSNDAKNAARTLIAQIADQGADTRVNTSYEKLAKQYKEFDIELLKIAAKTAQATQATQAAPQRMQSLPYLSWDIDTNPARYACPLHDALALVSAMQGG